MKKYLAALGLVAACGICCAPLLLPVIATLGAGTWVVGSNRAGAIVYIAGTVLIVVATVWLLRRRQQRRRVACDCIKACTPSAG